MNEKKFVCEYDGCGKSFQNNSNLIRHHKGVHLGIRKFECSYDGCNKTFKSKEHLKRHINVHLNIRKFKCSYDGCGKSFNYKGVLKQHINDIHLKIRNFKCPFCDYICYTNSILKKHINGVHLKIKNFGCNECSYKCSVKGHLKRHVKAVHTNIRDFICDNCPYKTTTKGRLTRHLKTCTGERNISGGENQVIQALSDLGFEEDLDYVFNTSYQPLTEYSGKALRFDFRFLDHDIVIEFDGRQHYQPAYFGSRTGLTLNEIEKLQNSNLKQVQALDRLKDDFCSEYDFKMIRIAYTDFANILSILSNELFHIVDWSEDKPEDYM